MVCENTLMESSLTTTEGAVLGLVAFGEASGYDLARLAASSVAHIWTPSQSQIYKTLPRLARAGLLRVREIEQRGRPDKAVYRITRTGRAALRRWLDEVEDEPGSGRAVFLLKLFFCDFASAGTAQAQLAAYRRFLARRLERYEALREGGRLFESDLPGLVLKHGIVRASATLGWIDQTAAALEAAATAGDDLVRRGKRRNRAREEEPA
jgi:DNA-binding PadR family transcriptional regulator